MARSLAGTAIALADLGWYVFPLAPGSKKPARGSAGQDDATCDVERVLEWWTDTPDANIGVHCRPSGLYVIDLDRHDPAADGVEAWRRLAGEHGHRPTTMVRTAGGGFHMYYRAPAGVELRNTAGKLAPGVDTRGNGYVVAPPSVVDGRAYVPVEPRAPVADLPPWVVEALTPAAPRAAPPVTLPRSTDPDAVVRRVHDLAAQIAAAPEGQGNHTAAQVAYMAGQYVGAGQITADAVLSILEGGYSSWTFNRPSDRQTMAGTIRRQVEAGMSVPRIWK